MNERVMVIVAHPDDEVLGCGGTIARHLADGDYVAVLYVADGETSRQMAALENRNFMATAACEALGVHQHHFLDFKDQRLDSMALLDITQAIEATAISDPTIIYTHHAGDLNRDHQIVHQAVMTAFRPLPGSTVKAIYAFEVISSTEWGTGFSPNHFVDIHGLPWLAKSNALECYESEMRPVPHARSMRNAAQLKGVRGATAGLNAAEAFVTMRTIVR